MEQFLGNIHVENMEFNTDMDKQREKDILAPFTYLKPVIRKKSVGDRVYQAIKRAIVIGELKPGQRIVEEQISMLMNTSRTPVREAIRRLEQEELVERLPKGGCIVKVLTTEDIEEIFGIRAVLESYAAYLATERITEEIIKKLTESIKQFEQALNNNDLSRLMELNTRFHEIIYQASGSKNLYGLINNFKAYIYIYRRSLLQSKKRAKVSLVDHKRIVEAMRQGNKNKVERLVRKHILRGKKYILGEIEKGEKL